MKLKVNLNKKLVETLTKEVISEAKVKKAIDKKKKDLKESEMLTSLFADAAKFDPAAITALVMSGLPIGAALKVIADTIKKDPKDPSKGLLDRIRDMGGKVQQNR
jgi:benzoyl-CoA reductase/2-hydroxyglutaryl-CoA dehydratase subunit BcrC/BadD/HgdB